jgi:hypothetical protein
VFTRVEDICCLLAAPTSMAPAFYCSGRHCHTRDRYIDANPWISRLWLMRHSNGDPVTLNSKTTSHRASYSDGIVSFVVSSQKPRLNCATANVFMFPMHLQPWNNQPHNACCVDMMILCGQKKQASKRRGSGVLKHLKIRLCTTS